MDIAFYRTTPDGEIQRTSGRFRTQPAVTSYASELSVDHMIGEFLRAIEAFNRLGSQWKVDYILDFSITLAPFRPAQGSSFIPTPRHIAVKKCVVNVQNRDDQLCFLYSILAHIHHVERNASRVCHYRPFLSELDTTGLSFPLAVKDVAKFERLNEDVAVNDMSFDERQPIPLYVTPRRQRKHLVNLLLLTDDESNAHHYVLIRDLSRLVSGRTKYSGKTFVCPYCLHFFCTRSYSNGTRPLMFRSRSTGCYISETGRRHAALYGDTEGTSGALRSIRRFRNVSNPGR